MIRPVGWHVSRQRMMDAHVVRFAEDIFHPA